MLMLMGTILGQQVRRVSFLMMTRNFCTQMQCLTLVPATISPSAFYVQLLQSSENLQEAKQLHARVIIMNLASNVHVCTTLLSTYGKLSAIEDARLVFDRIPRKNLFSWNAMITGYVSRGYSLQALQLFLALKWQKNLQQQPDNFTYPCILKASAMLQDLKLGGALQGDAIKQGFSCDEFVGGSLMDMYVKSGQILDARQVFEDMPVRDLVSWNLMISGLANHGFHDAVMAALRRMAGFGFLPDATTIVAGLSGCLNLAQGTELHRFVVVSGFGFDIRVRNALLSMYCRCQQTEFAAMLFRTMPDWDLISWNAMITGYAQAGHCQEALDLFGEMQMQGLLPDSVTVVEILWVLGKAAGEDLLQQARSVHSLCVKYGFETEVFVTNALMAVYAKSCSMQDAHGLFKFSVQKDVVSWNTLITGYMRSFRFEEALKVFQEMSCFSGFRPDSVTLVTAFCCCARLALFSGGTVLHGYIFKLGFGSYVSLLNAVLDMYAKCGSLEDAVRVFEDIPVKDSMSWTLMILGYGMHGHGDKAMALFDQIALLGLKFDTISFTAALRACSQSGMVDEGRKCFALMQDSGVQPDADHYACLVDLLSRSGHLQEAYEVIKKMPLRQTC